ncbi:hypothetical protein SAMN05216188_102296 [Lentzea xinjiangensis]|uniref:Uncharacterized protein n=1 Tax=Lentzea xinjiangensis TaxID=402600 RepID=A0A1H9DVN6_9PSEU|nr:hypothetical protein [Lentzea xinjiangensis]SEQ17505.1 hypothetical protein SAMN05216188_102296 [Lentzea xinjiangensis]
MPYVWWQSGYDQQCHAFSRDQADGSRSFYEAVCEHSVPGDRVSRAQAGALCTNCLIKVGTELPDLRWRA